MYDKILNNCYYIKTRVTSVQWLINWNFATRPASNLKALELDVYRNRMDHNGFEWFPNRANDHWSKHRYN